MDEKKILNAKKIAVIGNQGAGKTTLALKLADITGFDYIFIKYPASNAEINKKIRRRDNWIIDGDFGILNKADVIIFLDFPRRLCWPRGIKRAFKNFLKWDFWSLKSYMKIPEKLSFLFSWTIEVFRHPNEQRPRIVEESKIISEKKTVTLKTPQEVEYFLETIEKNRSVGFKGDNKFKHSKAA